MVFCIGVLYNRVMNKAIKITIWAVATSLIFYMYYFGGYRPSANSCVGPCIAPFALILVILVFSSVPTGLFLLTPEPKIDSKYYKVYKNCRFFGIIILSSLFIILFTHYMQQRNLI
jgi:hypothetical protein